LRGVAQGGGGKADGRQECGDGDDSSGAHQRFSKD
jgi:hypothetical protein